MSKIMRLVFMVVLISHHQVWSQNTYSPYTIFGIGDLHDRSLSNNFSMGELGIGTPSIWHINNMNPALLTVNTFSVFDIGIQGENRKISNETVSQTAGTAGYKNIAFAFPVISGRWTTSMGISPYSSLNYRFSSTVPIENTDNSTLIDFQGEGGLTEVNFSNGVRIASGLSVGIRSSFIFGFTEHQTTSYLIGAFEDYFPSTLIEKTNYKGFTYGFGIAYGKKLNEKSSLGFGITYDLAKDLSGSREVRFEATTLTGGTIVGDIVEGRSFDDYYHLPSKFGLGMSWIKTNFLKIGMDITRSNWQSDAGFGQDGEEYRATYSASVGMEIIPDYDDVDNYFSRVRYRIGFKYEQLPYVMAGGTINDIGVNFGWSLPVRAVSAINMAFKFGQRGRIEDNLLKERYFKFILGVTINDRWFVRRKFN